MFDSDEAELLRIIINNCFMLSTFFCPGELLKFGHFRISQSFERLSEKLLKIVHFAPYCIVSSLPYCRHVISPTGKIYADTC